MVSEFRNEPLADFSRRENRAKMEAAIEKLRSQLGREYDLLIGGDHVKAPEQFKSINPARKKEVVGVFQKATAEIAEQAVEVAASAFEEWKRVPPERRADILFKAAALMRERRFDFDAWMVVETSKSWIEADADTAEAIDFLEFYGREMLRYAGRQPVTPIPGEKNELFYIPMGVAVVIPPWNFPNAILTGMTSAALVTGNTVILKPSSDSPGIGRQVADVLHEAGIPKGVLNFLTGPGSIAGDVLVKHPKTRLIAFTGSKDVGLHILKAAAQMTPGQIWIKRVSAEMGGKDAIMVDSEADLDAAAKGIVVSAFGFQGQKCSACSRAIIDAQVYDEMVDRIAKAARGIRVGPTEDPDNTMGAVINANAFKSIVGYVETGKKEGRLVSGGEWSDSEGFFIQPTVFADVDPNATIAQEEIFGPVLAVTKAKNFDHALEIANGTEYGLTGSVYSRNERKLERARVEFHVGNLYFNRKCTGALVGGHPFGGFNMSGTNTKAGGRDYLLFFLQAKSVSRAV
jgi:1-pyrroline-5-carboxylate dehydrogenase